jgi:hypothetical protein
MKTLSLLLVAALVAVFAGAESTRFWEQTSYSSLSKGKLEGLALSSDGTFRLGPRFDLLKETDSAYLWAAVVDSKKNLYVGGGSPGRVYKIPPTGAPSVFFETQEIEIHALAVDRKDRLYAASAPDGKIYRITAEGTSTVFYDPKTKYIWDLVFDSKDNLYVATGDKGQIFRVSPEGEGKVFFSSEETHIRSLIVDQHDILFAGTDASGMILRIQSDGTPFVLYESPKKEVTALLEGPEGELYAAAVGDKVVTPGQPAPVVVQTVAAPQGVPQPPKNPPSMFTMNLAGGSEVYRITPDGSTQKLWASRNDIVYSLALNSAGRLLIGTGNDGKIYELEPGGLYTNIADSDSSQATALLAAGGDVIVATSNVGRLYRLRTEFAAQGSFVSEVFDAGRASLWGRLHWKQELPPDTQIRFETRSGNSSNPLLNWSPWKEAAITGTEAASASPRGRFFQWKAVLSSVRKDRTPELGSLRAAYLPNNVPPVIDDVQPTPPGYRFQQIPFGMQPPPKTITLQPLGSANVNPVQPVRIPQPAQMTADKGFVGVRWSASDDNDDTLTYSVYIRGEGEKDWKLLKENLSDTSYAWNSGNWPDGTYVVKVVASDSPSNPPSEALSASRESPPFEIDNTPPEIRDLKTAPDGKRLQISFRAADKMSVIQSAEYSIDGGEWKAALPTGRISDSRELQYQIQTPEVSAGEHTVVVRVSDRFQNEAVAKMVVSTAQSSAR